MDEGAVYAVALGIAIVVILVLYWLSSLRSGRGAVTIGQLPVNLPPEAITALETTLGATLGASLGAGFGKPASALIESMVETTSPITVISDGQAGKFYKLGLQVTPSDGGMPYPAEITSTVPSGLLSVVHPGTQLEVLVNPSQPDLVLPNWTPLLQQNPGAAGSGDAFTSVATSGNKSIKSSVTVRNVSFTTSNRMPANLGAFLSALPSGIVPTLEPGPPTLFVTGVRGTAVLKAAEPLGRARDVDPAAASESANDMLWQFTAEISVPGAQPSLATFRHPVPAEETPDLAPGVKLAVALDDPAKPTQCAVDWDQSPLQ